MASKIVSFRCPRELVTRADALAVSTRSSRSAVVVEALRYFLNHVEGRQGRVIPAYSGEEVLGRLAFEHHAKRLPRHGERPFVGL